MRLAFFLIPAMMIVMLGGGLSSATQAPGKTVWDGVYTAAQATRGKDAFAIHCGTCHGDDLAGGMGPALKGGVFMDHWLEDTVNSLFTRIKTTMPPNRPRLSEDMYLDILTHILQTNTFPTGAEELKADALENIRVVGKDGPAAVPNFALVRVVGCLTQGSDNAWRLTQASEPVRTRNPEKSPEAELKASAAVPLGTHTFRLLQPDYFSPAFRIADHKGHKMEGKGFLIRNPTDQRISVTWLETLAPSCPE